MKAWKHWTSLGVLACGGTLAFSACGEDPCAVALSCIERPPTNDDPDSGNGGTSSDGDSGSNVGSSGTGNGNNGSGGSTGMADGSIDMDGGFNGPQLDGGNDAGQVEPPPPVCGVNPVVGCVASTQDAVFVSAGVDESGDGSQQAPVKTIAEGIELARDQDATRILVCNGVYQEQVSLTVDDSGRSLSGGYNCDSWLYNPDGETLVRPTERGYALSVSGTTQRVTISNLTFDAMAAVDPGESSIAAFIVGSSDVRLKQVRLIAHEGVSADAGVTQPFVAGMTDEWPLQTSLNGAAGLGYTTAGAATFVGGARTEALCPDGTITRSGRGGAKPNDPGAQPGEDGQYPIGKGGEGGEAISGCDSCDNAICGCDVPSGANGLTGDPGENGSGAVEYGSLASSGWASASGLPGDIGGPGGGGGGGDGTWYACGMGGDAGWYGGGGGGAGGCGGNGGAPGAGGGSSIALAVLDSNVTLIECDLSTADAGDGSLGDVGQDGQEGGAGGSATGGTYSQPCTGGAGGTGGPGGPGGGGAGGISAGVLWAGDFEPTVDADTLITLGEPGAAGVGGDPGNNDGIAGVAQAILEVPAG